MSVPIYSILIATKPTAGWLSFSLTLMMEYGSNNSSVCRLGDMIASSMEYSRRAVRLLSWNQNKKKKTATMARH